MKIMYEEGTVKSQYTVEEIGKQVKNEYGFNYTITDEGGNVKLTFTLDNLLNIVLVLEFDKMEYTKLLSYKLIFPREYVDLKYTTIALESYTSAIESTRQLNDLFSRMGFVK